jgi:hypothetical protein
MDGAELVRLAERVYARLADAQPLYRDEIIAIIGSDEAYPVVRQGLNQVAKTEGRRGQAGGLTRTAQSPQVLSDRHLKNLRTFFDERGAVETGGPSPASKRALLSSDAERLRRLLETDGGSLGRREIIETLGLPEEQYGEATTELVDAGIAKKNRGRSGGLSLLEVPAGDDVQKPPPDPARPKESDLYPPFTTYLEKTAKQEDFSKSIVLQTFRTRQRKWESPDLTEVRVTPFPVLGQWELRVATYELKRADSWTIDSVLQTATYGEFAHESWLVVPSGDDGDWVEHFTKRVVDKAGGFGIGLATFIEEKGVMKKHMVPRRQLPDLARLHEWLEEVVDRLKQPQLMKDIANNIAWAKRKAEAGRD